MTEEKGFEIIVTDKKDEEIAFKIYEVDAKNLLFTQKVQLRVRAKKGRGRRGDMKIMSTDDLWLLGIKAVQDGTLLRFTIKSGIKTLVDIRG